MNRFLTLTSTGLFAAGLAILPISAFAQGGTTAAPATTTTTSAQPTVKHDGKVVAKDAAKEQTKTAGVKTPAAPVNKDAKAGTHG
jgi:hypothetical protein